MLDAGINSKTVKRIPGRPFQKGQSGNLAGRPKKAHDFKALIHKFLANKGKDRKTNLETLITRLYLDDPKTLLAYGFGKPIETHEISGEIQHTANPALIASARELAKAL